MMECVLEGFLYGRSRHSAIALFSLACLAILSLVGCRAKARPAHPPTTARGTTVKPAPRPDVPGMLPSVRLLLSGHDPVRSWRGSSKRWLAVMYLAATPQGQAFFRKCLGSPYRRARLLGLEGAGSCRSFKVIPAIMRALREDARSNAVYYASVDISCILGGPLYSPNSAQEIKRQRRDLAVWVGSRRHLWAGGSYVKYWSRVFARAVSRWNATKRFDSGSAADLADGVLLSWGQLLSTYSNPRRNIDAALKLLPPFLTLDVPTGGSGATSPAAMGGLRNRLYAGMVWQMQLIVGPMLPESVHINGENWRTNLAAFRKWWRVHRSERRSQWLLASLATKGYRTEHPNNVRRTVKALIMALRSHAHGGLDRATAAEVLNLACPRMPALITPPPKMSPSPHRESSLEIAAMYHDSIAAAIRWYFRYGRRARWSPSTGKYQILPKRKAAPRILLPAPKGDADGPPPGGIPEKP